MLLHTITEKHDAVKLMLREKKTEGERERMKGELSSHSMHIKYMTLRRRRILNHPYTLKGTSSVCMCDGLSVQEGASKQISHLALRIQGIGEISSSLLVSGGG